MKCHKVLNTGNLFKTWINQRLKISTVFWCYAYARVLNLHSQMRPILMTPTSVVKCKIQRCVHQASLATAALCWPGTGRARAVGIKRVNTRRKGRLIPSLKLTACHWKYAFPIGNFIFQPSISRGGPLVLGRVSYEWNAIVSLVYFGGPPQPFQIGMKNHFRWNVIIDLMWRQTVCMDGITKNTKKKTPLTLKFDPGIQRPSRHEGFWIEEVEELPGWVCLQKILVYDKRLIHAPRN